MSYASIKWWRQKIHLKNRRIILQRLRSTENQGSQTSNVICKKMNIFFYSVHSPDEALLLNLIYPRKIRWKLVTGRPHEERFLKISARTLWSAAPHNFRIYPCPFLGNRRYDPISKRSLSLPHKWEENRDTAGLSLSVLRLVINKGRLVHWAKSFRCVTDSSVYTSIYWRDWSNKEILPKVLLTASNDSLWWSNGDAYLGSLWFGRIC